MKKHSWMIGMALLAVPVAVGCNMEPAPKVPLQFQQDWGQVRGKLKYQLAVESFEAGQLDTAYRNLRESLALNSKSSDSHILLARILLERGEIAGAAKALEDAVAAGGDGAEIYYLKGVIAQRYQSLDVALSWYRQAAECDSMNAHYVAAIAETLVAMNRLSEALDLIRQRWTDFEQNATLRSLAGEIHLMLGQYEEAANAYREAARIAPDDTLVHLQLAAALTQAGKYEEGRAVLNTVITNTKGVGAEIPASGWMNLGRCCMALNDFQGARDALKKATTLAPKSVRGWMWYAEASIAVNDLLTARQAAARAADLEPHNSTCQLLLAFVCWRQNDLNTAGLLIDHILRDSPNDPLALALRERIAVGQPRDNARMPISLNGVSSRDHQQPDPLTRSCHLNPSPGSGPPRQP